MKQTLLFLLAFTVVLSLSGYTQITITSADLPTIGLQVIRAVDDITPVSPGDPGTNQVWDFSNLIATKFDTTFYLPADGTPNIQNYPDAEVAVRHFNGNLPPYWDYEYARYDNQGMRYVGDEDMLTIFGDYTMSVHISCNPNPLGLKLPFTYGDSYTQETTYEWHMATRNAGVLMDSIKQISHMEITTVGDASGIVSTPYGSYQALRVKDEIVSQDSVFNWTSNQWVFDRVELNNYSNYKWYTNDYYEIGNFTIDADKGNSMTFFKSETVVGVPGLPESNDNFIYPNPADDQITVSSTYPVNNIEIYDFAGHLLLQDNYNTSLNISSLAPGLFIVKVTTARGISYNKLIRK
jgi:hypothetical protein